MPVVHSKPFGLHQETLGTCFLPLSMTNRPTSHAFRRDHQSRGVPAGRAPIVPWSRPWGYMLDCHTVRRGWTGEARIQIRRAGGFLRRCTLVPDTLRSGRIEDDSPDSVIIAVNRLDQSFLSNDQTEGILCRIFAGERVDDRLPIFLPATDVCRLVMRTLTGS